MKNLLIIFILSSTINSFSQSVFSPKENSNSLGIAEDFMKNNPPTKSLLNLPEVDVLPLPNFKTPVLNTNNNDQSYLGFIKENVNFRKGPSTDFAIIKSLSAGTQIFIISTKENNNYYKVIDLSTNLEGYVYSTYITLDKPVEVNEDDLFVETGKSSLSTVSQVEVYNNTSKNLTIFIGGSNYLFSSQEKRSISIKPNEYTYRVTAAGVIPYLGKDTIKSGYNYSWEFYIVTK